MEGGTLVEVTGRDLGFSSKSVDDAVLIGKSKCNVVAYEMSSKYVFSHKIYFLLSESFLQSFLLDRYSIT